ncbi:hypothetical protein J2S74_002980 [Evansella vedderi]|uniref:Uncharacterized protein n=1 Tax=Evansella vedderi TaxID=38282 RepID=A0ABT9ZWK2_9BACI|nr:hypothetical protein [Evansella vedderi]
MVKRFIGTEASKYRVTGLCLIKEEINTFTGETSPIIESRMGTFHNPVNFLPFFQYVQQSV